MYYPPDAPVLPIGYFYRLNPNGRTFGGQRETIDICQPRRFLWFKWVKVLASAGVYRDNEIANMQALMAIRTPETSAATRAYELWMCSNEPHINTIVKESK